MEPLVLLGDNLPVINITDIYVSLNNPHPPFSGGDKVFCPVCPSIRPSLTIVCTHIEDCILLQHFYRTIFEGVIALLSQNISSKWEGAGWEIWSFHQKQPLLCSNLVIQNYLSKFHVSEFTSIFIFHSLYIFSYCHIYFMIYCFFPHQYLSLT